MQAKKSVIGKKMYLGIKTCSVNTPFLFSSRVTAVNQGRMGRLVEMGPQDRQAYGGKR